MINVLSVLAGGAIGSLIRYLVVLNLQKNQSAFPWGTFAVNLTGSLFIGIVWGLMETRNYESQWRVFIIVGLLGGFTTFSSLALEGYTMINAGKTTQAILYIGGSGILGLALVLAGVQLAKNF